MHGFLSIYFDNMVQEISAIWLAEKLEFYFNLINKLQKAKKQKKTQNRKKATKKERRRKTKKEKRKKRRPTFPRGETNLCQGVRFCLESYQNKGK